MSVPGGAWRTDGRTERRKDGRTERRKDGRAESRAKSASVGRMSGPQGGSEYTARPSAPESAIEKQPAWAAPISSSGFVPGSSSKRVPKEYWPSKAPLPSDMVPL